MKVTVAQLIQFVADNGIEAEVTVRDIEFVGLDTVLDGIGQQLDKNLRPHTDPTAAMWDYFCDGAFSHAFDIAWREAAMAR